MRICTTPGLKFILSCAGPLSLDLNGIEVFFKSIFNAQPALYDSTVIDVPWRQVPVKPTLKIGVVPASSIFPLHPPIQRALDEAIALLKAQGHQIVPLNEEDCRITEANEIAWNIFSLDQNAAKLIASVGEPPVPALGFIMKQLERLLQLSGTTLPDMSALDRLGRLALLNTRRAELREAWRKLWVQHDLEICIAPPAQNTALPHDTFGVAPYTAFLNYLDVRYCFSLGSVTWEFADLVAL